MTDSFVHLHLHSQFSQLDGMVRPGDLMSKCERNEMPAVAMTDHGNLYGAVDFFKAAKATGVKPILGCEMYLAPESLHGRKEVVGRKNSTHLTLLAKNETGWNNLIKLVTEAHLDGVYSDEPRTDRESLAKFSDGIICLSGCLEGPVNEWLRAGDVKRAQEEVALLRDIYGADDFYLELMDHGKEIQTKINRQLMDFSKEFGLKPVATNDVHFLNKTDHEAHDVMICIGGGDMVLSQNRKKYSPEVYLKTPEEMRKLFAEVPQACDATLEIAEKCDVDLHLDPTSSEKYPQFEAPDGSKREDYFRRVCFEGLEKRYPENKVEELAGMWDMSHEEVRKELEDRLNYEITTINDLGFASYFLITADFIEWGRDQGIPVGPGRGSAAGSLVAYTMWITNICPMRFGLLFERFLNPERVSPPDVDIDFCQSRRQEVIQYVREKYGERSVSHIITYGKLGAKSVIRDVGRVLGMSYGDTDFLAKMIDPMADKNLAGAYKRNPDLKNAIEGSSQFSELWGYATKLEGLQRNTGVHAAGVVIGDRELDEHVALTRANEGEVVTQLDMGGITDVGLLKMDFLGLKNLTVIQEAVEHIHEHTPGFDIEEASLDDKPTLDLLNRGETMGVFQLESGGMVKTCQNYGIQRIEDVIDLLAVYRPGAMQYIDEMIAVKKGVKKVNYEHPLLETICGDTYGVMIYQEQVQNAAKVLAGYTLGGADLLRRAMGKKKKEEMDKQRETFVAGAKEHNDIDPKMANKIFDKIAGFAGYGFNKSHSACYGHISYWTAYLKANFPVEFLAALLSNEINNTEKIAVFIAECQQMGIEVLPPDLNKSKLRFAPEVTEGGVKAIRYGLAAIKNVGENAMQLSIAEREANGEFESLDDFTNRVDTKVINKRILENLVKAGALDWAGETRAGMFARLEQVVASASSAHKDRAAGQVSLFDTMDFVSSSPADDAEDEIEEWSKDERLANEKELLGCYTSGHPLDAFRGVIDSSRFERLGLVNELDISDRRARFSFGGMVRSVQHKVTKSGKKFGIVTLEDFTGSSEIMMWEEQYLPAMENELLQEGKVLRMRCAVQVDDRSDSRRMTGSDIKELKARRATVKAGAGLTISLWVGRHRKSDLLKIKEILEENPGKTQVNLSFQNGGGRRAIIELGEKYKVRRSKELEKKLTAYLD